MGSNNINFTRSIGILVLSVFFSVLFGRVCTGGEVENAKQLAYRLSSEEGNHDAAAIEFRRIAMIVNDPEQQAGFYYGAAYEYFMVNQFDLTEKMLNKYVRLVGATEEVKFLKAESARRNRQIDVARSLFKDLVDTSENKDLNYFVSNNMASLMLLEGRVDRAEATLLNALPVNQCGLSAVHRYRKQKKKSPVLGGLLGFIPGLGYAYSGEYSSALRSFFLNGIFIFGMVDTANDKEWGAFTAISFFEMTWLSGSVFGGMDASYRYNRELLNAAQEEINGHQNFSLDLKKLPQISLSFKF